MTKFDFEKFVKESGSIKMNEAEKARIFNYLKSYSIINPVRDLVLTSHRSWSNQLNQLFLRPMPILIAIVILIGGGTTFAAERTLPGDILYPVKLSVNENIRGWLALSEDAKTELDISLAELRLEEAERLAVESRLNEDVRSRIEENFQKHADRVGSRIEKFESDKSSRVFAAASNFKTSLNAHAKILDDIGVSLNGEVEPHLVKLTTRIRAEAKNMEKNETQSETKLKVDQSSNIKTSAEGRLKATTNKIAEVKGYVERLNGNINAETRTQIDAQLKLSADILAQGEARLEAGAYGEAFILFQKAHNIAQRAKMFVRAKAEFENDDDSDSSTSPASNPTPTSSVSPMPSTSAGVNTELSSEIDDDNDDNDDNADEIKVRGKVRININF